MQRLRTLDALRGLAALVVVLWHVTCAVPDGRALLAPYILARPLIAGREAVQVFFVLSGFVLYHGLAGGEARFGAYLRRRWLRLYPPLAASLLLSAALCALVGTTPVAGVSEWFTTRSWTAYPTPGRLAADLLLLDTPAGARLNNALWSLAVELQVMPLFPLLVIGVRRSRMVTIAATLLLSLACQAWPRPSVLAGQIDLLRTGESVFLFAAGAALAAEAETLRTWFARRFAAPAAIVVALVLLCSVPELDSRWLVAAGAVLLVAASAHLPVADTGRAWPALDWLGRVSYSLYLVHLPVMLAVVHGLGGRVPLGVALTIAAPLILVVAALFHHWIERPAIRWSRAAPRPPALTPAAA